MPMQKLSGIELQIHSERVSEGMLYAAKMKGVKVGVNGKKLALANISKAEQFAHGMAPILQKLQADGYISIKDICYQLNSMGIPSPGGGKWHASNTNKLVRRCSKFVPLAKSVKKWHGASYFSKQLNSKEKVPAVIRPNERELRKVN